MCRRRGPEFIQESRRFARYGPEGFRQCKSYRACYDPGGRGKIWRQEKNYCMTYGRDFDDRRW